MDRAEMVAFKRRLAESEAQGPAALTKVLADEPKAMEELLVSEPALLSRVLALAAASAASAVPPQVAGKPASEELPDIVGFGYNPNHPYGGGQPMIGLWHVTLAHALTGHPALLARLITGTGA